MTSQTTPVAPVVPSVSFDEFAHPQACYAVDSIGTHGRKFDECPILEARKRWVACIPLDGEEYLDWFLERIRAYALHKDWPTTLLLLRHAGTQYQGKKHAEVVQEMSNVCLTLLNGGNATQFEDAFGILYGKLTHFPNMWPHGRAAVDTVFAKYWPNFPGDCEPKLLVKALRVIWGCGAAEYLPRLQEQAMKFTGPYSHTHIQQSPLGYEDLAKLEAFRLFLVAYFSNFTKVIVGVRSERSTTCRAVYLMQRNPTVADVLKKAGMELSSKTRVAARVGGTSLPTEPLPMWLTVRVKSGDTIDAWPE